ncbi:MAG: hypothetical protein CBR30_05225 [Dictyoglomus sp. NZ13-RE01]|nr:MAG: hypothetical protein CBR30_05225 [Dictyoglomus sp. NZ13-RE01]
MNMKLILLILILIFASVLINIEASKLKEENRKLLKLIQNLEEEKIYYENALLKSINLTELEEKALRMGFVYPKEALKIKVRNEKVISIDKIYFVKPNE